jgi:hypothetical protein
MDAKSQKKSLLESFVIHDRESCAQAIKNGGIAAMVSAALSSAFGIAGFFTSSSNKDLNYLLDPWILADVALLVVLGIFVFRKSRVAATLLVIYFVSAKGLMWYELGKPSGLLMAIVFFLYYITAMRGTYLWHSQYRDSANIAA